MCHFTVVPATAELSKYFSSDEVGKVRYASIESGVSSFGACFPTSGLIRPSYMTGILATNFSGGSTRQDTNAGSMDTVCLRHAVVQRALHPSWDPRVPCLWRSNSEQRPYELW